MSDQDRQRLDQWLWHARFFKSRTLAAALVGKGQVRVNGARVHKPAHSVIPGDVLTFAQGRLVRVVRIDALATRRGPASEAQGLYADLSPQPDPSPGSSPISQGGRPTGRDRRRLDALRKDGA